MFDQSQQDHRYGDDLIATETARIERARQQYERERVDPFFEASMPSIRRDAMTSTFQIPSMDEPSIGKKSAQDVERVFDIVVFLLTGQPLPPSPPRRNS